MKLFCLIVFLCFQALGLGIHIAKHGQPRNDEYNFWLAGFGLVINLLLLWGAGLFNNF